MCKPSVQDLSCDTTGLISVTTFSTQTPPLQLPSHQILKIASEEDLLESTSITKSSSLLSQLSSDYVPSSNESDLFDKENRNIAACDMINYFISQDPKSYQFGISGKIK